MSDTTALPSRRLRPSGIDWGDKKHAWALQVEGSSKVEQNELEHTPEAIQEWIAQLRRRFPSGCNRADR